MCFLTLFLLYSSIILFLFLIDVYQPLHCSTNSLIIYSNTKDFSDFDIEKIPKSQSYNIEYVKKPYPSNMHGIDIISELSFSSFNEEEPSLYDNTIVQQKQVNISVLLGKKPKETCCTIM